ncbi:hypothetical protein D9M72_587390 [compost metagenome]
MFSGAMSFMPLKPFRRAVPMRHSGPAVCPRKKASTSVADSVTMPKNTPPTPPQIRKYPSTAAASAVTTKASASANTELNPSPPKLIARTP